jgi:hypothetical protein
MFQFCDTENLVKFSKKLRTLFQFTQKEHIYPKKIPTFWFRKTTKFIGRKKSQPRTGYVKKDGVMISFERCVYL